MPRPVKVVSNSAERPGHLSQPPIPLRILLAEDGKVNQQVAAGLLSRRGHHVTIANNGQEAVEAASSGEFDMVLMDLEMPIMDGIAATSAIRDQEKSTGRRLPIVAVTAHDNDVERQECLDCGMDDFVSKPFCPEELFALIEGTSFQSPTATAADVSDVFDRQAALANVDGSEEILTDMIGLFGTEHVRQLEAIHQAYEAGDCEQLRRAAHALKGTASLFSAGPAVAAAKCIETIAASADLQGYDAAWFKLNQEFSRLKDALGSQP